MDLDVNFLVSHLANKNPNVKDKHVMNDTVRVTKNPTVGELKKIIQKRIWAMEKDHYGFSGSLVPLNTIHVYRGWGRHLASDTVRLSDTGSILEQCDGALKRRIWYPPSKGGAPDWLNPAIQVVLELELSVLTTTINIGDEHKHKLDESQQPLLTFRN